MSSISDISIRNPVFAWMLMAALMIFGLIGYGRMGVSQLPDIDFPVVAVTLSWQGAAPEVMETDIVDIVEDAVMGIQGIRDVATTIIQGNATMTVEFDLDRNIDVAVQEVQTRIGQAQRLLPTDMDPAIVTKVNPQDQPIVWLAVTGDLPLRDLIVYVQSTLKDRFSTIAGVGDIILGGYTDPNLRVWIDEKKLRANQVTALDVVNTIQQQHEEVPAGSIDTPRRSLNVRVMGEAPTPEAFGNIVILRRVSGPVFKKIHLRDVATVERGLADVQQRISRTNGRPSVGLGIRKQRGANEVATARRVLARLEEIRKTLPRGVNVEVVFDRTKFTQDSIRELVFTLVLSAVATSLVCWLFLGSWSATLNVLLAIPTSILGTFMVIYFMGFTLNTFTVLGLSLAVGIVVDDAIMVLENIVRYREQGLEKVEAARRGARQITFAALASTLALIAIFLPVAFMTGILGKFFYQYGVTISVAVAVSLLEALTLTPMRTSQFLRVGARTTRLGQSVDRSFRALAELYRRLLPRALAHRWLVVSGTLLFFVLSLSFIGILRKEFLPPQDQSIIVARIQTPVDSSIDYTLNRFQEIEKRLARRPEIERTFEAVGGFTGGDVSSGFLFITLKSPRRRTVVPPATHRLSQQELMGVLRRELNAIPDVKAILQDPSQSGFSAQRGFPVEFTVRGPDWNTLTAVSENLKNTIARTGLLTDVDSDYQGRVPEVHIRPDRAQAAARGVDVASIGATVNALIGGMPISKYTENGRRYDVRIRLAPLERATTGDIDRLQVWNNRGELEELRNVVTVVEEPTSPTITRRNRERAVTIDANVAPGKSQTAAMREIERLAARILPPGYRIVFSGSAQTFKESFASLMFVLLMGILVSYMVLASQFNSYLHPFIVLLALPFSVAGALIALWAGGQSINIYSFIGIILLMGIVKKNSILLVDFTNQYRRTGAGVHDALVAAGPVRLRPILMTSLATIVAALPPALAIGPGAETRIPMAIAVIGGVIFSTLLTLLVIPCAYRITARETMLSSDDLSKQ
jgi:HAE1 family hydrophobic/amphiphilic exporter-1